MPGTIFSRQTMKTAIGKRRGARPAEIMQFDQAMFESKLSNEAFVSRAPEKVVNDQKEKLAKNQALLAQLIESEKRLKK